MYCKSSRLNSFVTKETSVQILPPAVRRDTEPLLAILPLTEGWRNGRRRQTVSPQCLCPIENGFHGECGGHGPVGGKWPPTTVWPLSGTLQRRRSSKIPAMKKNPPIFSLSLCTCDVRQRLQHLQFVFISSRGVIDKYNPNISIISLLFADSKLLSCNLLIIAS